MFKNKVLYFHVLGKRLNLELELDLFPSREVNQNSVRVKTIYGKRLTSFVIHCQIISMAAMNQIVTRRVSMAP